MDHVSIERRSWLMAQVASRDTSPEMRVRRAAHRLGLRFRVHRADLPGKPDLVFARHNVVVFVHGCFWHRHRGCSKASAPKTRSAFWNSKFERNVERDAESVRELRDLGWTVRVVWECQTKEPALSWRLRRMFGLEVAS